MIVNLFTKSIALLTIGLFPIFMLKYRHHIMTPNPSSRHLFSAGASSTALLGAAPREEGRPPPLAAMVCPWRKRVAPPCGLNGGVHTGGQWWGPQPDVRPVVMHRCAREGHRRCAPLRGVDAQPGQELHAGQLQGFALVPLLEVVAADGGTLA